jgi:hypothetical protein
MAADNRSTQTAWRTQRKQNQRSIRYQHRKEDPRYEGVLVSTLRDCPHGTDYGYVEFGCRCLDQGPPAPETGEPTGCRPAGIAAAATRRRNRKARTDQQHTNPEPTDSALSRLDTHRLFGGEHTREGTHDHPDRG